ncbi:MAG: hypothetical protein WCJ02_04785, partial [bacterium]
SLEAWGAVKWPAWKDGTIVFKVDCRPYGVGSCDPWYARCHRDFGGALADWVKTDVADWKDNMRLYTERVLREERLKELDVDVESLRAAYQLVNKVPPPEFEQECTKVRSQDLAVIKAFQVQVTGLRRKVLFSHPGLDFDVLLFNKRQPPSSASHNVDQYLGRHTRPCPGLVALTDWKTDNPKPRLILKDKLPAGSILHPDLSYDASRVLFSFCDHTEPTAQNRRFLIYEAAVDGSWVRQVTGTKNDPMTREESRYTVMIEDFDPCYLPDGGFVFTSTRGQGFGRCHGGRYAPSFYLYRGELDGSGIRVFSYGEANEIDPAVLNDGRVVYNRWDYINRHDCRFHKLWTARPDGASVANYYGNLTPKPLSVAEPVVVPGSSKIMATATGHHSYTAGSILLIDVAKGDEGEEPLTHLTPEVHYPEYPGLDFPESNYCNPQPISENLFFAAWSPNPVLDIHMRKAMDNAFGIYLVFHVNGKAYRELIYRDPDISCFEPIPVKKRKRPPVLSTAMDTSLKSQFGTYSIWNIYESTQPIPAGSIKSLRVNEILNQTTARAPNRSWIMHEIAKKILGTVPVEPDGSVTFRAPVGKRLQLQALDANGMAVMTMRTFIYLQPGENASCVGCHEPRGQALQYRINLRTPPPTREIMPPAYPSRTDGFNYAVAVQPVWDRYCISCHGLKDKQAGGVNLLGTYKTCKVNSPPGGEARLSESYVSLVTRPGYFAKLDNNQQPNFSTPYEAFAAKSKLPELLMKGHQKVKVDALSLQCVIDWLDLNGQCYGNYSFNRDEDRQPSPEGEKSLRAAIAARFGPELARQPFEALVNNGLISESRILKAPLAIEAGGWGQITNGWTSLGDSGFIEMKKFVEASLQPLAVSDANGVCNHVKCECNSCWVKVVEDEFAAKPKK